MSAKRNDLRARKAFAQPALEREASFNCETGVGQLLGAFYGIVVSLHNDGCGCPEIRRREAETVLALRRAGDTHQQVDLAGRNGREELRHVGKRSGLDYDGRADERAQVVSAQPGQTTVCRVFEGRPSARERADDELRPDRDNAARRGRGAARGRWRCCKRELRDK